jgi:membrane-associated phospholipid phosphatase
MPVNDAMDDDWGYTRPNWRTPALATVGALALIGVCIAFVDRPLATFSHDVIHHPYWAKAVTKLAEAPDPIAILTLIVLAGLYAWRRQFGPASRTAAAAALATVLATITVIVLKVAFGRLWPETWTTPPNPSWITNHQFGFAPFHGGIGYESFPSGHTTRITAPFAVLWQRVPRWRLLWVLPTLVVAIGLLASDYHYLSDCIAGACLGIASAAAIMALL